MKKGNFNYICRKALLTVLSAGLVLSGCAGGEKNGETQNCNYH